MPSGLTYSLDELEHAAEARDPLRRHSVAVQIEQEVAGQKSFEDEAVIRRGLFEVDAVLARLAEDLRVDHRLAGLQPLPPLRCRPEERSEKHETDGVAQVVIPVHLAPLEMAGDVFAVHVQRPKQLAAERAGSTGGGIGEEIEAPDPADSTQRDVHRARPVDTVAPGVPRDPVRCLVDELARYRPSPVSE